MNKIKTIALLFLMSVLFIACSDDNGKNPDGGNDDPYIELTEQELPFDRLGSVKTINVDTNISGIECSVLPTGWCTVSYSAEKLTVTTTSNPNAQARIATVTLRGSGKTKTLKITQLGRNSSTGGIKDDIKLVVKSGQASSSQSGSGIEKTFDGDLTTIYHSSWSNSGANYFPITLTYDFEAVETMDYLVYNPRQEGDNGHFKELELWVATENEPALKKYGDYNFQGSSSANRISFTESLTKPTQIRFVIKSGAGDGVGFATCAEMEFYKNNDENFDFLTVFTDNTCSKLKSSVTEASIEAIGDVFYRDLAMEIFRGEYESEFRVQSYKSWQHPNILASQNKTSTYGLRDNPTGIYANAGEDLIVFVGEIDGVNPSLFIQDPKNKTSGSSFALSTGLNKITPPNSGLIYVMYYTNAGTEKPVTINIVTGTVNGYFDSQKHTTGDWNKLIKKASFKHFDIIGKYAVLTFETAALKQYTPDGLALINAYDKLVYLEQDFMGLVKYNKQYKNRAYFLVIYDSYMYASSYYTAYNSETQAELLNVNLFTTSSIWGPAHEVGHIHQTRPGLRWVGVTEVTNNIHSLYVQTEFGNRSRLILENRYSDAKAEIIDRGVPHNNADNDVFNKLVPFWQLKLYMHNILGNNDFYKDIYEKVRVNPDPATHGACQIEFVKIACDAAKLNLTDFFEKWGFLTPIDIDIDDYGTARFTITQEMINNCKAYIASKNYPAPTHANIHEINDENLSSFR